MKNGNSIVEIEAWLKKPEWHVGKVILEKYDLPVDKVKAKIACLRYSPTSRIIMAELLQAAYEKLSKKQANTLSSEKRWRKSNENELPVELQEVNSGIKERYAVINELRANLRSLIYTNAGTRRKRYSVAQAHALSWRLVEIDKEIVQLYKYLDYWQETKKIHPALKPHQMPNELKKAAELLEEQIAAVNYIRKADTYRRKHGKLQNPESYREKKMILDEIKSFIEKHG